MRSAHRRRVHVAPVVRYQSWRYISGDTIHPNAQVNAVVVKARHSCAAPADLDPGRTHLAKISAEPANFADIQSAVSGDVILLAGAEYGLCYWGIAGAKEANGTLAGCALLPRCEGPRRGGGLYFTSPGLGSGRRVPPSTRLPNCRPDCAEASNHHRPSGRFRDS